MLLFELLGNLVFIFLLIGLGLTSLGLIAAGILGQPVIPYPNYFARAAAGILLGLGMGKGVLIGLRLDGLYDTITSLLMSLSFLGAWAFCNFAEQMLGFYYSLTPHPAAASINRALSTGAPLDEKEFDAALLTPTANPVEEAIRRRQAEDLMHRASRHAAKLRAEADRLRKKANDRADFLTAHIGLADAVVESELEKVRLETLRKRVGR